MLLLPRIRSRGESKSIKTKVLVGKASPRDHGGQVVSYISCTLYPLPGHRGLEGEGAGEYPLVHGAGGGWGGVRLILSYEVQCFGHEFVAGKVFLFQN